MAQGDKKKKANGGGGQSTPAKKTGGAATGKAEAAKAEPKKGEAAKAEPKKGDADSAEKAVAATEPHGAGDKEHGRAAKGHGGPAGHGAHKVNRREYWVIFVVLFVLTVLEVVVAQLPGLSKTTLGISLVGLALSKAACVGLYYMHLKHETRILRFTVALPFAAPAVYAFVLIAEAAWRLTR